MRALVAVAGLACLVGCAAGPSGPSEPAGPPSAPTPQPTPSEGPLSGRWVGSTAEGMGLIATDRTRNDYCINRYDCEGTLSHRGTALTGTMTFRFVGADCLSGGRGYHIPPSAFGGDLNVTNELTLSVVPPGGVAVTWADWVRTVGGAAGDLNQDFGGSYTAQTINLGGQRADGRSSWEVTFGLRRP